MEEAAQNTTAKHHGPTRNDLFFLLFLVFVIAAVVLVGRISYQEGMKTENTKRNGEAWAKWLTEASAERAKDGFAPSACATGFVPQEKAAAVAIVSAPLAEAVGVDAIPKPQDAPAAVVVAQVPQVLAPSPRTWGECFNALTSPGGALADLRNPFFNKPIEIAVKCDSNDRSLTGALVLEKLTPTPPGSSIPVASAPLSSSDAIDQKIQIRITACDKGAYPIRIAEIEF